MDRVCPSQSVLGSEGVWMWWVPYRRDLFHPSSLVGAVPGTTPSVTVRLRPLSPSYVHPRPGRSLDRPGVVEAGLTGGETPSGHEEALRTWRTGFSSTSLSHLPTTDFNGHLSSRRFPGGGLDCPCTETDPKVKH